MAVTESDLEKYLVQVRRIAEHREAGAERKIKKMYEELTEDLNAWLGNCYAKYAEDDILDFAILRQKGQYARFLEEVQLKIDGIYPELKNTVEELIDNTYRVCWHGMYDGVTKSKRVEDLHKVFQASKAITPEQIKAAVQNPIPKLRLKPILERNRRQIICDIRREIGVGLSNGDRMSTMARRISKHVDGDYNKAMRIARTEAARVRERGLCDAIIRTDKLLQENGSGLRAVKIWHTKRDGAVRHTLSANHVDMEGQTVLADEDFTLPDGVKTLCPVNSGVAAHDCNCRCRVSMEIMNDAEFYAVTGRHFDGSIGPLNSNNTIKTTLTTTDENDIINVQQENINIKDIAVLSNTMPSQKDGEDFVKLINGSDNIKHAYKNYASKLQKVQMTADDGYYRPAQKSLVYSFSTQNQMANGISKYSTLAHEYGHFIDDIGSFSNIVHSEIDELNKTIGGTVSWFKNKASLSDEFLSAVRKDKMALRTLVYDSSFRNDIFSTDASVGLQDAIDGMFGSKAKMQWQHGDRYYNRKYSTLKSIKAEKRIQQAYKNLGFDASNQTKVKLLVRDYETASEIWANIMGAETCGGLELDYIKKYLPNAYQAFIKIIGGLT